MSDLIHRIRDRSETLAEACECADAQLPAKVFPATDSSDVNRLEIDLGFGIPSLYKSCYSNSFCSPGHLLVLRAWCSHLRVSPVRSPALLMYESLLKAIR